MPLRVAVMGCVVNGPGEAREADLGVASGNGKGQIFVKGEVIKTVPESQIVETLIEEAMRIAGEQIDAGDAVRPAGRQRQLTASRDAPPCSARPPARVLDEADEPAVHRLLADRPGRRPACSPGGVEAAGTAPASPRRRRCGASARAATSTRSASPAPT